MSIARENWMRWSTLGPVTDGLAAILTPGAVAFLVMLTRRFRPELQALLQRRIERQRAFDGGDLPTFSEATRSIREGDWRVAPLPDELADRRVEITGPVDRKMIINALNSGAQVFMADFEDSSAPTWSAMLEGQVNLRDAVARTIDFTHPQTGKAYRLSDDPAVLFVRPRGLHMVERHALVDGEPIPASLFDFGLYFYHNARALLARQSAPYFYLPKLESHLEARWWNQVFVAAQEALEVPVGSIKATVLVETLPAAFEMDEILFELRQHSAGLNCGRWDYIFSMIKTLRAHAHFVLPDRGQVGMDQPCMRAYADLVIRTCHRRGVHAMGGMAAQIPIKGDPEANQQALDRVRADKVREARAGHDGTWVAHPGLVPLAREIFDAHLDGPNQLQVKREDVRVEARDLLMVPTGTRTYAGVLQNISVGVQYLEAWLRGQGCVPLYDLMEDAATAEISRTQLWQWIRHGARLDDGRVVTRDLVTDAMRDELERLRDLHGADRFEDAQRLFIQLVTDDELTSFLTLPAYELLPS